MAVVADMYLEHFDLKTNPFTLKTDPQFLWVGSNQRQALATLAYGLQENRGIVVLGGEFGTGKTTLVNHFVTTLEGDVRVALLPEPGNSPEELLQALAGGFGVHGNPKSQEDLTTALRRLADDGEGRKRLLLLIIDEAQRLTAAMLEEVLHLARIDHRGSRLIHILLVGQNEVYQWLTGTTHATFIEEVSAACNLHPLSAAETAAYIEHRLKTAGAVRTPFAEDAIQTIHTVSRGIPRTINLACDFTLLQAHLKGFDRVDAELVLGFTGRFQITGLAEKEGSAVTVREIAPLPAAPNAERPSKDRPRRRLWAPLLLALSIAGGYLYYDGNRRDPMPPEMPAPAAPRGPEPAMPRLKQVQSGLIPKPAGVEALPPARPQPPGDGASTAAEGSQVRIPPKPAEKPQERRPPAVPGATAEQSPGENRPSGAVPQKTEPPKPTTPAAPPPAASAPVRADAAAQPAPPTAGAPPAPPTPDVPRPASPVPARSEVAAQPAPPAAGNEVQGDPDPGALIDWLLQGKQKEGGKPVPPGGEPRP